MSYTEHHLMPGETIVYHANLHWITLCRTFLIALIAAPCFFFGKYGMLVGASIIALLALPVLVHALTTMATSEFTVTNKRVVIKIGLVSRQSHETLLSRIEGIDVIQSLLGRMLGFGTIVIDGTGGSRTRFNRIDNPLEFRLQVQEQIDANESTRREVLPVV